MGQSKRRKQQLGDLYGTPEGSKAEKFSPLVLRAMTQEEKNGINVNVIYNDGRRLLSSKKTYFLIGSIDGVEFPIIVNPVIDEFGRFNSYVFHAKPAIKGIHPLEGRRKATDHRAVNEYLLDHADSFASE